MNANELQNFQKKSSGICQEKILDFHCFLDNFEKMWKDKSMKKNMGGVVEIKLCRTLDPTESQKRFWGDLDIKLKPISALRSIKSSKKTK